MNSWIPRCYNTHIYENDLELIIFIGIELKVKDFPLNCPCRFFAIHIYTKNKNH